MEKVTITIEGYIFKVWPGATIDIVDNFMYVYENAQVLGYNDFAEIIER